MKKIGLTGGIGTGKTYVSEIFEKLNIPVFNSDTYAKQCLSNDKVLIEKLKKEFGNAIYDGDLLQKEVLSNIVFNDSNSLEKLNRLVHPLVNEKFKSWCDLQEETPFIIKEAAILFESGLHLYLDAIICVSCPEEIRIRRIKQRDNISTDLIQKRINSQMAQDKKEQISDFIIVNDDKELLVPQIIELINQLKNS